ncbi:MAG: cytochrome c biogenesis protein CcsA [bacterium]
MPDKILFGVVVIVYLLSVIPNFKQKGRIILISAGLIIQTLGLVILSINTGHPPFTNLYESLLFLSWLIPIIWLVGLKWFQWVNLGVWTTLLSAAGIITSLTFTWQTKPLMPALQSPWLHIHVSSCFLAYAFFSLATISAIVSLFKDKEKRFSEVTIYLIKLGFPLLTFGIISGAIWAYFAWGRYWGWDPKEVWALITWLYYALFLHLRFIGVSKKTLSYLAIVGLLVILFTFLGVSFLVSGLHSYL